MFARQCGVSTTTLDLRLRFLQAPRHDTGKGVNSAYYEAITTQIMRIAVYCNYTACNNAKDEDFTDSQSGSAEETPPPQYPAILRHSENTHFRTETYNS